MSAGTASSDERDPNDIGPVIALRSSGNAGLWLFLGLLLVGGYFVFSLMSERRAAVTAPRTSAIGAGSDGSLIASPPPLALPQSYSEPDGEADSPYGQRRLPPAPTPVSRPAAQPTFAPRPAPTYTQPAPRAEPVPLRQVQPVTVYSSAQGLQLPAASDGKAQGAGRVRASRLANPAFTVPQGTVIPAVLETALDSTRPGGVRALVQRDVYGFDGTRVLIPRGSRLYGEYDADLDAGQKRAKVRWTRLLRPDGVTIALDSPASDPLGRAGIRGKVDGKFFQRLGGALLQSVLNVGVGYAANQATGGVVVALPGATQNVQIQDANRIKPTLSVKQGTSVSVFVARDLDFSGVDY